MVFLSAVLLKISVFDGKKYMEASVLQRTDSTDIKKQRGMIYDRNMCPLVDSRTYIDFKEKDGKTVKYTYTKRYDALSLASHFIGYTDLSGKGVCGIEKIYDSYLWSDATYSINTIKDVKNNTIDKFGIRSQNKNVPGMSLKLTLDYHIQKEAEEAMKNKKATGSVVVLDAKNFDLLASVSSPSFDRTDVGKYVNSSKGELIDRSISQYNAGSIFKIITCAAALENNDFNENSKFFCTGSSNVNSVIFNCHKKDGHGFLNLESAFYNSCNCAFYEMGIKCQIKKIQKCAESFGLGKKVINFDNEFCGNVNLKKAVTNADMANISIGQGDILITPVQAVKIAAIIANDGVSKNVNTAMCLVDKNGKETGNFYKNDEKRAIKKDTARKIGKMMEKCVLYGTGTGAKSKELSISGKTGTAQTGWLKDGSLMVHGWFVGFFPSEKPKYAMCVFLENGKSSNSAAVIFKEIAEKICNDLN